MAENIGSKVRAADERAFEVGETLQVAAKNTSKILLWVLARSNRPTNGRSSWNACVGFARFGCS